MLDPACGSGAFLSETLSYLVRFGQALAYGGLVTGEARLFDADRPVRPGEFLPQVFGIDILHESVEITRLSEALSHGLSHSPDVSVPFVAATGTDAVPCETTETASEAGPEAAGRGKEGGGRYWTRTSDHQLVELVLYQLS